ncbi:hypothetical protein SAMN05421820_115131 [Pedobacter steynii]|uniref:Phytase-like domain-containing protein n=1 Tax=Pedobacter steynii TaxID=430522 RepID=A0A1H0K0Z5_9SPHI|nr:hypothetical protein [Pedobacter steynii]NQX43215.1 hypothetical protein [Pedobacter steynii]SDO49433.1 hypothetical protein SAMN05421820_115131 [Pedobacter steynii]
MYKFTLELLFHIIGIGSASGLFLKDNSLHVIGDNSAYFYEYELKSSALKRYPLSENPAENITKKLKPDFEALAFYDHSFYLFGSGSTENRNKMVQLNANTKEVIAVKDLSALYKSMQVLSGLTAENFNLEGVVHAGDCWYFFNRGNGNSGQNIVFTVSDKQLSGDAKITFKTLQLPEIKGIRTGFTDAIEVGDKLYFLAAAENTNSTYNDGEVLGSVIGCIDVKTMNIDFTKQISDRHKFEGLTLQYKEKGEISFLLCEDNDSDQLQADIYLLKLKH